MNSFHSVWAERRDLPLTILSWVGVMLITFWLLGHIRHSLLLLVIAVFLAAALVPVVSFFERFVPRFFAILFVYIILFSCLGTVVYFFLHTAIEQLKMFSHNISYLLTPDGNGSSPVVVALTQLGVSQDQIAQTSVQLATQAEQLTTSIVPLIGSFFTLILDMVLVTVISIYFMVDGRKMMNWLRKSAPVNHKAHILFFLNTLERIVGGYIRGQLTLAVTIGLLIGIGMTLFHVQYAVLLGVLSFVLAFVPIFGTLISGSICVLLALTQGWLTAVLVLGYFILMHLVEGDIVGPRIVGKALGIHPLVSIIALVIGSELYGVVGVLFASPVAGVLQAISLSLWSEWKATHPESFSEHSDEE